MISDLFPTSPLSSWLCRKRELERATDYGKTSIFQELGISIIFSNRVFNDVKDRRADGKQCEDLGLQELLMELRYIWAHNLEIPTRCCFLLAGSPVRGSLFKHIKFRQGNMACLLDLVRSGKP